MQANKLKPNAQTYHAVTLVCICQKFHSLAIFFFKSVLDNVVLTVEYRKYKV